jgi:hypothetical protein
MEKIEKERVKLKKNKEKRINDLQVSDNVHDIVLMI